MRQVALTAFATFLVTVAPVKVAPVFLALTGKLAPGDRRRVAIRATLVAGGIMFFFGLLGDDVLKALGISLSGVRIGGGILLLLLAIRLVGEEAEVAGGAEGSPGDIAIFPLATPMIAGPATITATLCMASGHKNEIPENVVMFAMMALVLLITYACLVGAAAVERWLGATGMNVVGRILGILLAALAADLVMAGLRESGVFR
jgi:multiple antibiotic resistance protein